MGGINSNAFFKNHCQLEHKLVIRLTFCYYSLPLKSLPLIDLHTHLGGAVPSAALWEILCDSGLRTEFKRFEDLHDYLSVDMDSIKSLDEFLGMYFHMTELIQSSPEAASKAAYQAVVKAYRRSKIDAIELRYNPLKRVRGGLHRMDAIVMGTLQGLLRASTHYPVKTGVIFSMGRELSSRSNAQIVNEAIRFCSNGPLNGAYGVVGIDMAGPESLKKEKNKKWLSEIAKLTKRARKAGLGITWHIGETSCSGPEGMIRVIEAIKPDRIGHGIELRKAKGKTKDKLCSLLREHNICLEICPSVNLVTRSIKSLSEIADLVRLLVKEKIAFCLNTDNPYLIHTNAKREYELIEKELGRDKKILRKGYEYAKKATFLKG